MSLQDNISVVLSLFLKETDLLADKLEACENFSKLYIVLCCYFLAYVCCYDSLNSYRVLWHCAKGCSFLTNIFEKHCAYFISAEQNIVALRVRYCDTNSVTVWVCCKKKIRLYCLAKLKSLCKCLFDLRVREWAGREVSVRIFLLRYYCYFLYAYLLKDSSYRLVSCAVKRSVYYLQSAVCYEVSMYTLLCYLVKILVDNFLLIYSILPDLIPSSKSITFAPPNISTALILPITVFATSSVI